MKYLIIFFIAVARLACADEVADVALISTVWTNGANITDAAYYNSITVHSSAGAGTWITNGFGHTNSFAATVTNLYGRVLNIGGQRYPDLTNNIAIALSMTNNNNWMQYNFTTPQSEVLMVMMVQFGAHVTGGSGVFDIFNINAGSKDVISQYYEAQNIGGTDYPTIYAHNAATTEFDQPIFNFTLSTKWYILTLFKSVSRDVAIITLIDADTGVVFGSSSVTPALQSEMSPFVSIGRFDNHAPTDEQGGPETSGPAPANTVIKDWHVIVGAAADAPYHWRDQVIWNVNHMIAGNMR
ncbi:MAG TPA: hypothetical protein VH413_16280 [Verrucomicrobiae bacterium]|jgi:hypothetical protein|nr:hypothetical protein [Verrucomicrobiae bacterium]